MAPSLLLATNSEAQVNRCHLCAVVILGGGAIEENRADAPFWGRGVMRRGRGTEMATYGFVISILPGKEAENRAFAAELLGPRRAEYEASRRRLGLRAERVWEQATPAGPVSVDYLEADDLAAAFT